MCSLDRLIALVCLVLSLTSKYNPTRADSDFLSSEDKPKNGSNLAVEVLKYAARGILDVVLGVVRTTNEIYSFTQFAIKHRNPNQKSCPVSLILDSKSQKKLDDGEELPEDSNPTPVIIWHGMGDTAVGMIDFDRLLIQRFSPDTPVLFVQVGATPEVDFSASFLVDSNYQVEQACEQILKNPVIKKRRAFNAVGYSQGSQFLRALIERCPLRENNIRVRNYISIGGQHQGVFGMPGCEVDNSCENYRRLLTAVAYTQRIQRSSVQASYWHDPFQESKYKRKNRFIADINNEYVLNETYKDNLLQLENMVLIKFLNDSMVIPKESSHFGFFKPKTVKEVMPFTETNLYKEDRIGLKTLHETGRLHLLDKIGEHLQYSGKWYFKTIVSKFLNN